MILKYRDTDNNWNWIDEIRSFKKVTSPTNEDEYIKVGQEGDQPLFVEAIFKNGDFVAYEMYVKEAYICNDSNGSTIDVLKGVNSSNQAL